MLNLRPRSVLCPGHSIRRCEDGAFVAYRHKLAVAVGDRAQLVLYPGLSCNPVRTVRGGQDRNHRWIRVVSTANRHEQAVPVNDRGEASTRPRLADDPTQSVRGSQNRAASTRDHKLPVSISNAAQFG